MKYLTLEDISVSISSGITPSRSNKKFWNNGIYPWLKTEQIGAFEIKETSEHITQEAIDSTSIKIYPKNTISIAMYGEGETRGKVSILKAEMSTNQACCNVIINEKLADYRFVYYWLKNNYLQLRGLSSGVRKNLNTQIISAFQIPNCSIQEQSKKAELLYTLDKKISINNSIISKLEEMAKTIYEYWFLQFDFPNHEGKPYASSGGAMKYSEELGREIPIDWEAIEIDKICKIYSGFAFKSAQYVKEGKYRLITIKNVQENGVLLEPANFIDELPKKLPAYCLLEQGDILMSLTGNVGRVGLMFDDMCLLNQRVAKICPSNEEMRGLIYFLFKSTFVKSKMENMAGGTSQENLSPIETGKILIPYNKKIFRSFSKVANQWVSMIVKKQRENQKLAQLRDWLLPMLMNGQVRVE